MPPKPPYYAVIFPNRRTTEDNEGYAAMAAAMVELAQQQPGYLGMDSVRDPESREGITVSYWQDEESILAWKQVSEHRLAQKMGREKWYESYTAHVARVDRSYGFGNNEDA
ncbi:antibiotic biosynthesis monooxygenase family protein [Emcibacter nanhaiensis]|uniref:Antibiotic biosynthesis monooxygenase n=1 Tax=Emcibacter nanhaiensis TaxID=1505037 RepID=A0A501PCF7_9PROT|nr:antibiotic biosynthesis monooxygenase [Emcibacter nanhaiensis]TPD57646.1 antibiotic biosynthesis monooxygenase [Emcibacter nanhaiensis]